MLFWVSLIVSKVLFIQTFNCRNFKHTKHGNIQTLRQLFTLFLSQLLRAQKLRILIQSNKSKIPLDLSEISPFSDGNFFVLISTVCNFSFFLICISTLRVPSLAFSYSMMEILCCKLSVFFDHVSDFRPSGIVLKH